MPTLYTGWYIIVKQWKTLKISDQRRPWSECQNVCLELICWNLYETVFVLIFQLQFTISTLAVSGLKVNRLDMYGEVSYNHSLMEMDTYERFCYHFAKRDNFWKQEVASVVFENLQKWEILFQMEQILFFIP